MVESNGKEIRCGDCPLRKRAEARPNSLIARFWRWHTSWCPGWKAYQEYLSEQGGSPEG